MTPIDVNEALFQKEVLQANALVVVDFWAPWCAPCRIIAPILKEISEEYNGRVKVVKVNTDENQALALKYNIRSIPTVMIFRDGESVDEIIGAVPKHLIKNKIEYYAQGATGLN